MSSSKSALRPQDRLVIFPTNGWRDPQGQWSLRVHGWVFSLEESSAWRRVAARKIARWLGDWLEEPTGNEQAIDRFRYFLVDNKPGRQLKLQLGEQVESLPPSRSNGHLEGTVHVQSPQLVIAHRGCSESFLRPDVTQEEQAHLLGGLPEIAMLESQGLSVVCDIDDTIKVSQVRDKRALLRRTFFLPWEPVDHMPAVLRRYCAQDIALHYVTAMPWPLYPAFDRFLEDFSIPRGSVDMREFRWKDRSALAMIRSSESHKRQRLVRLLDRFPQRHFVLIGDSAERDPEIYADLARARPEQVIGIFIRNVSDEAATHERYVQAFAAIDPSRCCVFDCASELPTDLRSWVGQRVASPIT